MGFEENSSYYDILELAPDASPQEIRNSYLKLKSAYSKNSAALYTLIEESETQDLLKKIEEAYQTLSNPETRKKYDRSYGLLSFEERLEGHPMEHRSTVRQKIVEIDHFPKREMGQDQEFGSSEEGDELLVAPRMDYSNASSPFQTQPPQQERDHFSSNQDVNNGEEKETALKRIEEKISREVEWSGAFIKEVREQKMISIEDMAEYTKLSKTYLRAIEEEDFQKLPAAVFLRGFMIQIAKKLKLPAEKVAAAYVARYRQNCPDKA